MVLLASFLFYLTFFFHRSQSISQTVGIRTCDNDRASALGTSFIRFHGSESFSGWFEWNGSKIRGEYEEISFNTNVGVTSDVTIVFSNIQLEVWCISEVKLNGETLNMPSEASATGEVWLGFCMSYSVPAGGVCASQFIFTVPDATFMDSTICRSQDDCENNEYCDVYGACLHDSLCCYYKDPIGTNECPNQDKCDGSHQCKGHADCGANYYCAVTKYCYPYEDCCVTNNAIDNQCPVECNFDPMSANCQEFSGAKECLPYELKAPMTTKETCEAECLKVDSCYGIQSKTTFGDWNDCLLFYGNCDIEFNSKVGGQYTLLSRACFDKGLSSVNNDYTLVSGQNCVPANSGVYRGMSYIGLALDVCSDDHTCVGVVDKNCNGEGYYLCFSEDEIYGNSRSCMYEKESANIGQPIQDEYSVDIHMCSDVDPNNPPTVEFEFINASGQFVTYFAKLTPDNESWYNFKLEATFGTIVEMNILPMTNERFCIDQLSINDDDWPLPSDGTIWLANDCSVYTDKKCNEIIYLSADLSVDTCIKLLSAKDLPSITDSFDSVWVTIYADGFFPVDSEATSTNPPDWTSMEEVFCFPGELRTVYYEIYAEHTDTGLRIILGTAEQILFKPSDGTAAVAYESTVIIHPEGIMKIQHWFPDDAPEDYMADGTLTSYCEGQNALDTYDCSEFIHDDPNIRYQCNQNKVAAGTICIVGGCVLANKFDGQELKCTKGGRWQVYVDIPQTKPTSSNCVDNPLQPCYEFVRKLKQDGISCKDRLIGPSVNAYDACCATCREYYPEDAFVFDDAVESEETFTEEFPWVFPLIITILAASICVVCYFIYISRKKKHEVRRETMTKTIKAFSTRNDPYDDVQEYEDPVATLPELPVNALSINVYERGDDVEIKREGVWHSGIVQDVNKSRVLVKIDQSSLARWIDVGSNNVRRQMSGYGGISAPKQPVLSENESKENFDEVAYSNFGDLPNLPDGSTVGQGPSDDITPELRPSVHSQMTKASQEAIDTVFIKFDVDQDSMLNYQEYEVLITHCNPKDVSFGQYRQVYDEIHGATGNITKYDLINFLKKSYGNGSIYQKAQLSLLYELQQNQSTRSPLWEEPIADNLMLLTVNMVDSAQNFHITALPQESVKSVLNKISNLSNAPNLQYCLLFNDVVLEPNTTLESYELTTNSTLLCQVLEDPNIYRME